jgi:putative glutamine amidotransferase
MPQNNGTFRHAISSTYIEAVIAAGGAPVLIPASDDEYAIRAIYRRLDGLLLSGGADIDPAFYGEEINGTEEIDRMRDKTELMITRWAIEDKMPTLGICRGQQLLNVALGGSLVQDIPTQIPDSPLNHRLSHQLQQRDYLAHSVALEPGSRLASMLETTGLEVNTLHHQSVKAVGQGLKIVGVAPDGVVEALESEDPARWIFSVQSHPEELWRQHEWARKLFDEFIVQSRRYMLVRS